MNKYPLALFDFDGTLADTAPDMVKALNLLRASRSKEPLPFEHLRPHISNGTPALIRLGFNCAPEENGFQELREEFLDLYEQNLYSETVLFPGIDAILEKMNETGIQWGIVTNKPEYLTVKIVEHLGLSDSVACVVGGDTLPQRKPNPLPVIHACKLAGISPNSSVFIGDSIRDIEAGRDAGLHTIGVTYGYIPPHDDPKSWGADYLVDAVAEIPAQLWM